MNYQNGKIYRIDCLTTNEVYIGSTCQPTVAKRLAHHVSTFKQWKRTGKGFITSYPIIERDNYKITMIESYPCNSKDELSSREGFYIRSINCVNKHIAGRSQKQWFEEHKEVLIERGKEYREANKEQISERKKEWREANKEKLIKQRKEYREANKEQICERDKDFYEANKVRLKELRDANKEQINARRKELRDENKDKINARQRELRMQKKMNNIT